MQQLMKKYNIITKEFLFFEYWTNNKNMCEIASIVGCSPENIFLRMKKFNIPTRNRSESQKGKIHSKETKEKISNSKTGVKIGPHSKEWNKKIGQANSLARIGMKLSGIKWTYESKAFELIVDNKDTTYTPDFYLPEFDCWIEIKGYWRDDAKVKFKEFEKKYINVNIKVLNKKELLEMSII